MFPQYIRVATVAIGCVAAGIATIIMLSKHKWLNKNPPSALVAKLKHGKWTKVGTVRHLYLYPIMCGKKYEVPCCTFQDDGLTVLNDHGGLLRDKMFVVYDEETLCVKTYRNFKCITEFNIQAVNKNTISFKNGNASLLVDLRHETLKKHKIVKCKVWNNSDNTLYGIKCIDCGNEAAAWMSEHLTRKCSGLRLGYYLNETLEVFTLWDTNWQRLRDINNSMRWTVDKNKQLPSYTMITEESLNDLKRTLWQKNKLPYDFYASFVITVPKAFSECQYEYLKIGNDVIISNLKPLIRSRINPLAIPNDFKLKLMRVNWKVLSSGQVKVNDEVYIPSADK